MKAARIETVSEPEYLAAELVAREKQEFVAGQVRGAAQPAKPVAR